jgi:beta-glucosidase
MAAITRRNFLKVTGLTAGTAAVTSGLSLAPITAGTALADESSSSSDSEQTYDSDYCFNEGYEACVNLETEGAVLLKNADNLLPLASGTKVTLLGAISYNYVEGGTGSAGGADDENTVMMNDAFNEAGLDVNAEGWSWLEEQCGGERGVSDADPGSEGGDAGGMMGGFGDSNSWAQYQHIHEFASDVYESGKDKLTASGYTDYAVVTFSRSGAEGASPSMDMDGDGSTLTGTTYLELSDNEKDLLAFCKENYAHTIVLVNSATPMELGFIDSDDYNVDACLWIGHPGEAGLIGVASLIAGNECPSGRLVDTYAYDVTTNPTYYNTDDNRYTNVQIATGQVGMGTQTGNQTFYQYEEGIYVGYRYYETADAMGYFDSADFSSIQFKNGSVKGYDQVVQFPFGFGLSYTTFTEEISSSDVKLEPHGTNTVTVKVTNTGDVAAKRAVELYMEAPWQSDTENFGIRGVGLEKPKVVLVAFGKSDKIEPGKSADVTLTFKTDDLASFDNFGQGCYVLENGTYKFNVQDNAHMWGDAGSENAATATVEANLETPIVYDEDGDFAGANYAGARDSDSIVAKNSMDDVTAGDGNMLEGYLSRSDFASGMKQIMTHTSDEEPNEQMTEGAKAVLESSGTTETEYTFETYLKGVKTSVTETLYAKGANMMPFASKTPDGTDVSNMDFPEWEKTYYVVEGQDENGVPKIVDSEPSDGSSHKLTIADLAGVSIDSEEGLAAWDKLANMTTMDEAIEVQGNSGWKVPAVDSVGMPQQKCQDGPGEPANGTREGNTWFPCAVTIAATWNTDLARQEGVAYGHQAILSGVQGAYAPAMNIHRSPFGGRNFEYYSEDGFISGKIGGSAAAGIMSTGTNVFAKHCSMNDGDTNRGGNTCWANEQAIREIYMRPFEISIKEYGLNGVMGSLNRIGLSWFHYGMYVTMMRKEWNWYGFLITDGDGNDGDVYNSPQQMLSVDGAILNNGGYINNATTVAAYGDATAYPYGQQCLHNVIRYAMYQYAGPKGVDEEGNTITTGVETSSGSSTPTGAIVVGGLAAAAVLVGALFAIKKHRGKGADEADDANADDVEDDVDDEDEDDDE